MDRVANVRMLNHGRNDQKYELCIWYYCSVHRGIPLIPPFSSHGSAMFNTHTSRATLQRLVSVKKPIRSGLGAVFHFRHRVQVPSVGQGNVSGFH